MVRLCSRYALVQGSVGLFHYLEGIRASSEPPHDASAIESLLLAAVEGGAATLSAVFEYASQQHASTAPKQACPHCFLHPGLRLPLGLFHTAIANDDPEALRILLALNQRRAEHSHADFHSWDPAKVATLASHLYSSSECKRQFECLQVRLRCVMLDFILLDDGPVPRVSVCVNICIWMVPFGFGAKKPRNNITFSCIDSNPYCILKVFIYI